MTPTDPITGEFVPFTEQQLQERDWLRRWRLAIAGAIVLYSGALSLAYWLGYTVGGLS